MKRTAQLAGTLLLALGGCLFAQRGPEPAPARQPAAREGAQGKPAPRLANPATVIQRLMRMTPEERERALEKLPPARQAQIRERLQRFDALPRQEQERRLQLGQMFANLTPEKQDLVRRRIQELNQLPDERRGQVVAAFQRLRRLPDGERQARMASPQFRRRFTPDEQQMLADLADNLPPPSAAPQP